MFKNYLVKVRDIINDSYSCSLIWSIKRIINENSKLGDILEGLHIPFNGLLLVADGEN